MGEGGDIRKRPLHTAREAEKSGRRGAEVRPEQESEIWGKRSWKGIERKALGSSDKGGGGGGGWAGGKEEEGKRTSGTGREEGRPRGQHQGREAPRAGRRLTQGPGREGAPTIGARGDRPLRAGGCPAVDALVAQHVLAAPEALAALPAGKGPRSRVRLAVAHQVLAPVEGLATLAARVGLLTGGQRAQRGPGAAGVRVAVAPQVLLAPKGLPALRAGVRLLARVALPVAQQVSWFQGRLAALGAGRGARGRQEGGQARRQRGAAGLLLVGAHSLGVPRRRPLSPRGGACWEKKQSQPLGLYQGRAGTAQAGVEAGRERLKQKPLGWEEGWDVGFFFMPVSPVPSSAWHTVNAPYLIVDGWLAG